MDLYTVDAFTGERFAGNPAAVCLADEDLDEALMQAIAAEMNLAETAFVRHDGDEVGLRWFTPAVEVDLCGHATLAAAHVLFELETNVEQVAFSTRSGMLVVARAEGGLEMDFPALPATAVAIPEGLEEALGAAPLFAGRNRFDLLVELEDEMAVRALRPLLGTLVGFAPRGVIVTARADEGSGADFVSRFFAPAVGIDEDPVTGSAHCALGPFWSERLGRAALVGYQASRRGGTVGVRVRGDRTMLSGQAVTVMRGTIA